MNCTEFEKLSMYYFNGEANEEQTAALREHIEICSCCKESFDSVTKMIELLEEPEDFNIDDAFTSDVMAKIDAYEESRQRTAELLKKIVVPVSLSILVLGIFWWLLIFKIFNFALILYKFINVSKIIIELIVAFIIALDVKGFLSNVNAQIHFFLPITLILFGIKLTTDNHKEKNQSHI